MQTNRSGARSHLDTERIRQHLAKVCDSATFAQSSRLKLFLEFLVNAELNGDAHEIKESVIAAEVYQRGTGFDPKQDSIVRTEASRLRKKLKEYYDSLRTPDDVVFDLPRGGYTIRVEMRPSPEAAPAPPPVAPRRNFRLAIAAAAVIVVVAGVLTYRSLTPRPQAELFHVTSLPGRQVHPTLSPDGAMLAFAWDGEEQDNFDIYAKNLRENSVIRLTSDPAPDRSPAWSPDGRTIAFLREQPGRNRQGVYIVPATGGPERQITSINSWIAGIAWTADSRQLIVPDGSDDAVLDLHLVSVATGERHRLVSNGACFHPTVSPDGRTLAFACDSSGDGLTMIYTMPLAPNGQAERAPTPIRESLATKVMFPTWTRDGQSLLFSSRLNNYAAGYRLHLASRKVERLAALGTGVSQVLESTGGLLVFSRETQHFLVAQVAPNAKPVPAFRTVEDDFGPALSPDGRKLALISNRSGILSLWITDPDGSHPVEARLPGVLPARARWEPDSKHVVFRGITGTVAQVYRASVSGGTPTRFILDGADNSSPSVSRDGKWLYYASTRSGHSEIWRAPIEGGLGELVTPAGVESFSAEESPDGQWLYYWSHGGVHRMLLRDHTSTLAWSGIPTLNFQVTADGIYYETLSNGDVMGVKFRPFDGSAERVYQSSVPVQGWSVIPGQPHLLMGLRRLQSNIDGYLNR